MKISFVNYSESYLMDCLRLFDENCPQYFAENEKLEYIRFLETSPPGYLLVERGKDIVAAFGLTVSPNTIPNRTRLSWILVSPNAKGHGVGIAMMNHVQQLASEQGVVTIDIAASHLSASFFAKFGAIKLAEYPDGWGAGMHRVDMQLKV